jgi:hypothetical protein
MRKRANSMKAKSIVTFLAVAVFQSGVSILAAADSAASPQDGPQNDSPRQLRRQGGIQPPLAPDVREKLRAAREKAKTDPDLVAARDDLKEAMNDMRDTGRAAILKDDPSMQEIFDKLDKAKGKNPLPPEPQASPAPPAASGSDMVPPKDVPPHPDVLTGAERAKLAAAHEKVRDEADVKAAREKLLEAQKNLRAAREKAVLKADPSLEPVIKKLEQRRENKPLRRPGLKRQGGPAPSPVPTEEPAAPQTSGT